MRSFLNAPRSGPRIRWGIYEASKRAIDVVASAAGLAAAAPLMGVVAAAVRLTMGSPVLFRQERPGLHGRPFQLTKFRTMRAPRPGEGLTADVARIMPLGRFLRSTSLDELPTLWNVLRGDMSLVGPRPLLMEYLTRYTPEQARRHDVRPGITCWALIKGRNANDWDTKLALDTWYVNHRSMRLDLAILARTFWKVLARKGVSAAGHATMPEFTGSSTSTAATPASAAPAQPRGVAGSSPARSP